MSREGRKFKGKFLAVDELSRKLYSDPFQSRRNLCSLGILSRTVDRIFSLAVHHHGDGTARALQDLRDLVSLKK